MDDLVKAAMAKWPHVPHCYGWLALDARGNWYMRDDRIQAAGPFPAVKGSRIEHDKLLAFIERNYSCENTADGGRKDSAAWYFQNGPQRVYVQLEAAPFVWRVHEKTPDGHWPLVSHTGLPAVHKSAWLCEAGRLFLDTDMGFGLVHSLDMGLALQAVEAGAWQPQELPFAQMPARFGYVLAPKPLAEPAPQPSPQPPAQAAPTPR